MVFNLLFVFLLLQRGVELMIAKRNEAWLKAKGAVEIGKKQYILIILLHSFFFISLLLEVKLGQRELIAWWLPLGILLLLVQGLRIWSLLSLGRYWNTKILVLSGGSVRVQGPYKYIRHPNYLVVMLEFAVIPLLFQAYITAILCSLANFLILSRRIALEEQSLLEATDYANHFQQRGRFLPNKLEE